MTRSSRMTSMGCLLLQQIRQERQEARPLDRLGQQPLLLGRNGGDAAGDDLSAFGQEALQQLYVLVVDLGRLIAGEGAGLAPAKERPPCATGATTGTASVATPVAAAGLRIGHAHAGSPSGGVNP